MLFYVIVCPGGLLYPELGLLAVYIYEEKCFPFYYSQARIALYGFIDWKEIEGRDKQ